MTTARVQQGVPTGGQFAATARSAATDVDLDLGAMSSQRDAAFNTRWDSSREAEKLSLKMVGAHIKETYPEVTHVVLGDGDQSEDDVTVSQLLDANGNEIEFDYDDQLDEYVMGLSGRTLKNYDAVEVKGHRNNPEYVIDVSKASQIDTPEPTSPSTLAPEVQQHVASLRAQIAADDARSEEMLEATNDGMNYAETQDYEEFRRELSDRRAEQLTQLLTMLN